MVLLMARPTTRVNSQMGYYRARVPTDLAAKMKGREVQLEVAGETIAVTIGSDVKVSLRTKDTLQIKARHAHVGAQVQAIWNAARSGPQELTFFEVCRLAGELYCETIAASADNPGSPADWAFSRDLLTDALSHFDRPTVDFGSDEAYNPKQGIAELEGLTSLKYFLSRRGLELSPATYRMFMEQGGGALWRAYDTLERRSKGDFGPDRHIGRFPSVSSSSSEAVPLFDLFERWKREQERGAKTVREWEVHLREFIEFVGHDDANQFIRADVINWKDHLRAKGLTPKTINSGRLSTLSTILQWGVHNARLSANAAAKVKIVERQAAGKNMLPFSDREVAAIFNAASTAADPTVRWVPHLLYFTGARAVEICQLRAKDIREEQGIWCIDINAEAGPLKNANAERLVPIHSFLLRSGFLEFVHAAGDGPLFYTAKRRNEEAFRSSASLAAQKVAKWTHTLGLEIGREFRKDPLHAWRHTFAKVLRDNDEVKDDVLRHVQGRGFKDVTARYGTTSLTTSQRAIERVPIPSRPADNELQSGREG